MDIKFHLVAKKRESQRNKIFIQPNSNLNEHVEV